MQGLGAEKLRYDYAAAKIIKSAGLETDQAMQQLNKRIAEVQALTIDLLQRYRDVFAKPTNGSRIS